MHKAITMRNHSGDRSNVIISVQFILRNRKKTGDVASVCARAHTYVLCILNIYTYIHTRAYPNVSGLAAWSENCKWYSSLPLGAIVSLFVSQSTEFCRHNPLYCFSTSVCCCCCCCLFRYRFSQETCGYSLVCVCVCVYVYVYTHTHITY
jgi:hypothetical protein